MNNSIGNQLTVLIRGRGYNASKLVGILPYCRVTIQKLLRDPDEFTLKDLHRLVAKRILTYEEVFSAITAKERSKK